MAADAAVAVISHLLLSEVAPLLGIDLPKENHSHLVLIHAVKVLANGASPLIGLVILKEFVSHLDETDLQIFEELIKAIPIEEKRNTQALTDLSL